MLGGGEGGDLRGLGVSGVVLPEPGLGVRVLLELLVEGQGLAGAVDGERGRAGRVDADADDRGGIESLDLLLRLGQGRGHGRLDAEDPVGRVLAGQVRVLRIEEDAGLAARVVEDGRSDLVPVADIDDEGPDGVGAEIEAESVLGGFHGLIILRRDTPGNPIWNRPHS